jgi:hypothetical protein
MADDPDLCQRLWTDLVARPSGPMAFRFILLADAYVQLDDRFQAKTTLQSEKYSFQ